MAILPKCPSCGFESPEIRCPRCNALKLIGCDGRCSACAASCPSAPVPASGATEPTTMPEDPAADDGSS